MEAELRNALRDVEIQLVEGDNGIFDVHADDRLLFSRRREGRFPHPGEIARSLGRGDA